MAIERVIEEKLGQMLIKEGLLSEESLKKALDEQKQRGYGKTPLGSFLVEMGLVQERDIVRMLGLQFNLPVMELKNVTIDRSVLSLIPETMARRFLVIPLFKIEQELTVAIADPTDIQLLDQLASMSKCRIQPILASPTEIRTALDLQYTADIEKSLLDSEGGKDEQIGVAEVERLRKAGKEIPIINIVDQILNQAVDERASDIHVEPGESKLVIRFRTDGILREAMSFAMSLHPAITSRIKIISCLDIAERNVPQDGRIELKHGKKELDVRVSVLPTYYGEKVVMRLLDRSNTMIGLEDLGFSKENFAAFNRLIRQPYGIVLVTGPTGSGKTTTLYAALNAVKSVETNITTVEDPVEYQIAGVNHVPINVKRGMTFAGSLRSILRQDPDIIMVGEIRDPETGRIAAEAALTGHLVLSTLHTNDAPSSIIRLTDMGIEPFLLVPSLLGVIAQRLVRKVCDKCRTETDPPEELLESLGLSGVKSRIRFVRGKGCDACKQTGYRGRCGIHELLVVDEPIRKMIARGETAERLREYALSQGFKEMRYDGILKAIAGVTTLEEILRVTKTM